jgi:urease subunit alpha
VRASARSRWRANGAISVPDPLVRLADSGLAVEVERDEATGIAAGMGGTLRDGLAVRAERGGVGLAITDVLLLDPVLGVRRTSIGVTDGRITAVGRAGNPDTMDAIDVVLDVGTAVIDGRELAATPGGIDSHVHWLSPQVCDAALAGGLTTLVIQDFGPIWNLGCNPEEGLRATWAALEAQPLNACLLVRASSSRRVPVEQALRAGGGGLKIHEDVGAGPEQLRCALDVADAHDVQLAVHTDGMNELLSVEDTIAVTAGRTWHAFHVEGCGGGHWPDTLALAGRERILTSSTTPTVPFGVNAVAEHRAMVPAVHVLAPGVVHGDATIVRHRVRAGTMAAEGLLHDLGVIAMLSSDSQGMGRVGEVVRRAFQNAAAMRALLGAGPGPADNERVLRHLAKVTINPAIAHGLAGHVGSLEPGKLADVVLWQPHLFGLRPEIVLKAGVAVYGASGEGNASTGLSEPVLLRRQVGGTGRAPALLSVAFLARAALDADLPTERLRVAVEGCRDLTAASMVRHGRTGEVRVDARTHAVTLDGEPLAAPALEVVALSGRYLLG